MSPSRTRVGAVAPFVGISALALLATGLRLSDTDWALVIVAGVIAAVVSCAAAVAPRERLLVAPLPLLPIAVDGVIALLRQAQGGNASGYGPLVVLPVVWVALVGSRRAVAAVTVATGLVFATPVLLVGKPLYPATSWRAALLWTIVAAVVGWVILRVVARERAARTSAVRRSAGLDRLVRAQTALSTSNADAGNVPGLIAACALTVAESDAACVQVLDGDDIVCRAVAGTASPDLVGARYQALRSLAGACFRGGETLLCEDSESDSRVARDACRLIGARTLIMVPLRDGGAVRAVLAVWSTVPRGFQGYEVQLLDVFAHAGAAALTRAELVGQLSRQATTDDLTGLPNRRGWHEKLDDALARSIRHRSPLSVLLLDLDGFKTVNDTLGHAAGDDLLERVSAAWSQAIRDVDTLGRLGGDEFAIILEAADDEVARHVVERLEATTPEDVGVSIGLAVWDRHEPAARLLARADERMYTNKHSKDGRSSRHLVTQRG
ncbi:MAG TPA: sensor domain-containing diguanylate cyclase [Mycobacteriales bacterium]